MVVVKPWGPKVVGVRPSCGLSFEIGDHHLRFKVGGPGKCQSEQASRMARGQANLYKPEQSKCNTCQQVRVTSDSHRGDPWNKGEGSTILLAPGKISPISKCTTPNQRLLNGLSESQCIFSNQMNNMEPLKANPKPAGDPKQSIT